MSQTSARTPPSACRVIRPDESIYRGKQGFDFADGISTQSAGAKGLCMILLTVPPGARAGAHRHENHETAIYLLGGAVDTWWGVRLEHHVVLQAGEMLFIPAGMPHLAWNKGDAPAHAVIARTDPNEQESVVLMPELDELVG